MRFLRTVADDTEDAPWMVMNERQWRSATALFWSLEIYARTHLVSWYPGGMLPLTYLPPGTRRRKQVAPDVFAAHIPLTGRDSLAVEEDMPSFVLEIVSASSVQRDLEDKTAIYRVLGAQEYAIVRLDLAVPRLEGYRCEETGAWGVWVPDGQGRLWSAVLGLALTMVGDEVRAMTPEGDLVRTPRELEAAREQEARAHAQAEAEVARLRAVLARLAKDDDGTRQPED